MSKPAIKKPCNSRNILTIPKSSLDCCGVGIYLTTRAPQHA
jgi:hypothetical protein